jgi:hypothetical protein
MPDQVVLDDLPADVTMRVFERLAVLDNGTLVWLRRFVLDGPGRRRYLADGRWLALHGGDVAHLYASPLDATHGGQAMWAYRAPHSYPTWQAALDAAQQAEDADERARARKGQ